MKFDSTKVLATINEICGPRFAGPVATEMLFEYASERLTESGWLVERIESSIPNSDGSSLPSEALIARYPSESPASYRVTVLATPGSANYGESVQRLGDLLTSWMVRKAE